MHRISIHPDGLTASAMTTATLATDLTAITTRTATAAPDLLAPAFGLIGTDFLTAYAAAHATHVSTLTDLSAVLAGMGITTDAAASAYTSHDTDYATALLAIDREMRA